MEMKVRAIIEIAGFPEDHVKKTMDMVMDNLTKEKGIVIVSKTVAPVEHVQKMWSTFAELELKFDELKILNDFCFNYMPSSIEIIDPINLNNHANDMSDFLNDLLARLHNFTMYIKNLQAENEVLKRESSGGLKK
ncbi:MAG: hypothetical protein PHF86_06025 [Candidatus Nanoarchaeia archaeon]|nr:hypothetical protein [Candidatus Nanoarchaeia archaeon]